MSEWRGTKVAVVPCYNAGSAVRPVIEKTLAVVDRVIVVDDGSTDGSINALQDLPVRSISFTENRGKGAAMLAGFRAALEDPDATCIMLLDADGQHDPGEIPALYQAFLDQHADLVIGSRTFVRKDVPWASWIGNRLTVVAVRFLLGASLPDTQSGFRLYSRRFLEDLVQTVPPGRYETEMAILVKAVREGYRILPVPIKTIYEKGNPTSHFRKVRDSLRVYRALLFK